MVSMNLCWNVVLGTFLVTFAYAGYADYQEPVHFARTSTSSSSQSVSSSQSSTTSTNYQSFANDQPEAETDRSFPLSSDGVICHHRLYGKRRSGTSQPGSNTASTARLPSPLANLSPFVCHVQCLDQTSTPPSKRDCQKIINVMKNTNKKSITIEPQSTFSVEYKECALVFENSSPKDVTVIYSWRSLTEQAVKLQNQCASSSYGGGYPSSYQSQSSGVCFFSSCDVEKSLQNYASDIDSTGNSRATDTIIENSGIMINFQGNKPVNYK